MLSPSSLLLSMMVLEIGNKGGKFLMFLLPIGWHSVLADDVFRRKGTTGESDGGVLSSCPRGGFTPEEVLPVLLLPMSWLCDLVVGLFSLSCNAWMLIKLSLIDQSFTNHWYIYLYISSWTWMVLNVKCYISPFNYHSWSRNSLQEFCLEKDDGSVRIFNHFWSPSNH